MRSLMGTATAIVALFWMLVGPAVAQTPPATQADGEVATEIERRLSVDREVNAQNVTIFVRDGVVTLTGRVPGEDVKRRAEGLAAAVPGVTEVRNNIAAGLGGTAGREPTTTIPEQLPGAH